MARKHPIEAKLHEVFGIVKENVFANRQAYLKALLAHVNKTLKATKDAGWDDLEDDVQGWINDATTANNDKKKMPDFDDVNVAEPDNDSDAASLSVSSANNTEDSEDNDAGVRRRRPAAAKKVASRESSAKSASKTTSRSGRERDPDDDNNDERDDNRRERGRARRPDTSSHKTPDEERPLRAAKARRGSDNGKGVSITTSVKEIMLKNPAISKEDLKAALSKKGLVCSDATSSVIRQDFRHSLRFLDERGHLKGLNVKPAREGDGRSR